MNVDTSTVCEVEFSTARRRGTRKDERVRYTTSSSQIIYETIDGETIIIDLATGTYYSLRGTGGAIWDLLMEGRDSTQLATALAAEYTAPVDEIETAVESFLGELIGASLIAHAANEAAPAAPVADGLNSTTPTQAFVPPVLEQFTDMQDIILLDPVHEVGSRGWPHAESA